MLTFRDFLFGLGGSIIATIGAYAIHLNKIALENRKIKSDNEKFIQGRTKFIESKYGLYKNVMEKISKLTGPMYDLYSGLLQNKSISSDKIKNVFNEALLNKALDEVVSLIRSDQLVVPRKIHVYITRNYCLEVKKLLENLEVKIGLLSAQNDESLLREIRNIANEIIAHNDTAKGFLSEDMDSTVEAIRKKL